MAGSVEFNRAALVGREMEYVAQAARSGGLAGGRTFSRRCVHLLERETGAARVLLTPSCSHALELASVVLDIQSGDEIIMPSFTFVSTANAFALRGARPVFVDIRPDTLNLDESLVSPAITDRTRAIVPVHYAGVGCEMDAIGAIAAEHSIPIIEDNAQGLFGRYKGSPLGSFGALSAVSFHETKNITCGEGGALFINDAGMVERAEIIREKGTDRARFLRGQVDKYTWRAIGSSYLLSDVLAAFLLAQLEEREAIQAKRRAVWEAYMDGLSDWANASGVQLPVVPAHCETTHHIFFLVMPSLEHRTRLIAALAESGIQATFHYQPLHASPMGGTWGYGDGDLPVTERVAQCLVRLPLHASLTEDDVARVVQAITRFSC